MKGVVLSTSFFILIFATFLSLGWYVSYDHNRSIINYNFKKSLFQVANNILDKDVITEDLVIDYLVDEISASLPRNFNYQFQLLGFNNDPILLRFKVIATSKNNLYSFTLEETLLEKEIKDVEE